MFKEPIVSVEQVKTVCDVSYRTANELVSTLCEHGILTEITGQNRNRLFAFSAYLAIFEPVENAE
ncbi:MAG: hypothetical protein CSB47_03855 [Proteobacteria bacterium]|nr:MAG: hypothetical protein CSB47_03855 [Pseudomonadota bacterium]